MAEKEEALAGQALYQKAVFTNQVEDEVYKLKKFIQQQRDQIQQDIYMFYEKYAKMDGTLDVAEVRPYLNRSETKLTLGEYRKLVDEALGGSAQADVLLNDFNKRRYLTRLESLQLQMDSQLILFGQAEAEVLEGSLYEAYTDTYYKQMHMLQRAAEFGQPFEILNTRAVNEACNAKWAQRKWSEAIWEDVGILQKSVEEIMDAGITQGTSVDRMARDLDRVMGKGLYNAQRLIRTETAKVYEDATLKAYQEAGIEFYVFMAELDGHTSKICRDLDSSSIPIEEASTGFNYPPMHPNCRSTTVAKDPDETDLASRMAMAQDGSSYEVPGDMSYAEWFENHVAHDEQYMASIKRQQNRTADKKQLKEMQQYLGRKDAALKSIDNFQDLKYNEAIGYQKLRHDLRAEKFREKIKNREVAQNVSRQKQARHMAGDDAWKKRIQSDIEEGRTLTSMFKPGTDVEQLVGRYCGSGTIRYKNPKNQYPREYIQTDRTVGYVFDRGAAKYLSTRRMEIVYSKNGVHAYPVIERGVHDEI